MGRFLLVAATTLLACAPAATPPPRNRPNTWFPRLPQPWAGTVTVSFQEVPAEVRVDGQPLKLSAFSAAAMLDTRTLADGRHRLEAQWKDGTTQVQGCDSRNVPPSGTLQAHFTRVDQHWLSEGAIANWGGETTRAAVAGDVDGDGDLDVFAFEPRSARLFVQDAPWQFREVPVPLGSSEILKAAAFADLNGDGAAEIVASASGLTLFGWKNGQLVSRPLDLGMPAAGAGNGNGFDVGDFDGDGLLDFSMGRVDCGSLDHRAFLFLNEGDGHFRDAAPDLDLAIPDSAPFTLLFERPSPGLPVDVIPFAEGCAPLAWWVQRFTPSPAGPAAGPRTTIPGAFAAMGSVRLDVDGDGSLELYVAGTDNNPVLGGTDYQQDLASTHGLAAFADGLGGLSEQWGMALVDVEMKGLPSVVVVQGNNRPELGDALRPRTQLAWQHRPGAFVEAAAAAGLDFPGNCRTLVAADLDADGDSDLLAGCHEGLRVYRNDGATGPGRTVVLHGTVSNPGGVDAQLRATQTGEKRLVRGGGGVLVAAVGNESMRLAGDTLEVTWPSGLVQRVEAGEAPVLQVREPQVLELPTRRVAPGAAAVKVVLRPGAAGAAAGTLALANAEWEEPPQPDAEGALVGTIKVPATEAVVTVTATLDGRELLVHPNLFVRK